MFSSQIYCVTFVNHRCTGGFTYFTLHFIHATFCIEPRSIGLNEDEARKQNLDVIIKKLPVMAIPRAKTLGETDGLLKAVIDKNTGKIVGCMLFAPDASEVINIVAMAMKTGQDYTFLRDFIFTHPSMSEALNDLFS